MILVPFKQKQQRKKSLFGNTLFTSFNQFDGLVHIEEINIEEMSAKHQFCSAR